MSSLLTEVREVVAAVLLDPASADVRTRLIEIGVVDLIAEEPRAAIAGIFQEHGAQGRLTGALDLVIAPQGVPDGPRVLYPAGFTVRAFTGPSGVPAPVDGIVLGESVPDGELLVVDTSSSGISSARVALEEMEVEPADGFARHLPAWRVWGVAPALEPVADGSALLATARWALAWQLIGSAETLLSTTVDYVRTRAQFGRPLSDRQAVRHRLADVATAVLAARAVVDACEFTDPFAGAAAKAIAGRAALAASECTLQLHGAIGFSAELGVARQVRAVGVLETLLGSTRALTTGLGRRMIREEIKILSRLDIEPTHW